MVRERGDTLVEVLIAVTILSAAIVGGLAIMNHGYSLASNAVERTQVQATMEGQLSIIRYARDAYIRAGEQPTDAGSRLWDGMQTYVTTGASSQAVCNGNTPQPQNGFWLRDTLNNLDEASVNNYSGTVATALATPGQGMWLEARRSGGSLPYIDFYVKACWQGIGNVAQQEARSVLRLYVP
jgi:Tfp pilus assembly protein PilV